MLKILPSECPMQNFLQYAALKKMKWKKLKKIGEFHLAIQISKKC
jgi:hypothetical protein